MKSRKQDKTGSIFSTGELKVSQTTLKKYEECKIIQQQGRIIDNPLVIKVEAGATVPLTDISNYAFVKMNVGLEVPIDLQSVDLAEAYTEAKQIVLDEAGSLASEMIRGLVRREDNRLEMVEDDEPTTGEDESDVWKGKID